MKSILFSSFLPELLTLRRSKSLFLLLILGALSARAQVPFDCNGRIYRVMEEQGGSNLQEVLIDYENTDISFQDLAFYNGVSINGIGYRLEDNFIYGVILGKSYTLCRIDAEFQLEKLRELPLPNNLLFVSGDISPDNRYLVLLGFSPSEPGNLMALVDLSTAAHRTQLIPMSVQGTATGGIKSADIAFHPTNGKLYGFDHESKRLAAIDLERRRIDVSPFSPIDNISGNLPSIFFDAFGNLMAIGNELDVLSNRSWFRLDVTTGAAEKLKDLRFEGNQDACSCPYRVSLLNTVYPNRLYPCTRSVVQLVIINRSPFDQSGISLRDTFPEGVIIETLDLGGLEGTILSGPGNNILAIDDLEIDIGVDTILVQIEVSENAPATVFPNQAYLLEVNSAYTDDLETVYSDDPGTDLFNDPSIMRISELSVNFDESLQQICPGESILLNPQILGAESYRWSDGTSEPVLAVTTPGVYGVTVSTSCTTAEGSIDVTDSEISVDLGADVSLELGEVLPLEPTVQSNSPVILYFWSDGGTNTLECNTCPTTTALPDSAGYYYLTVENEAGCSVTDSLRVELSDFEFYSPNAFTPNGDGVNDYFFLHTPSARLIKSLRIFDRWGNIAFVVRDRESNNLEQGWNGQVGGKLSAPGIYLWQAELQKKNGESIYLSGDVLLIR